LGADFGDRKIAVQLANDLTNLIGQSRRAARSAQGEMHLADIF